MNYARYVHLYILCKFSQSFVASDLACRYFCLALYFLVLSVVARGCAVILYRIWKLYLLMVLHSRTALYST